MTSATLKPTKPTKPTTFRSWYDGNLFSQTPTPPAWATDGRLMVRLDALRLKSQRVLVLKPSRNRVPMPGGDEKVANVIAQASRDTWTSLPRHIGALFHAAGYVDARSRSRKLDIPERGYAVVCADREHGGMPILFEPVALAWILDAVRWSALRLDPVRSTLWLVGVDGEPLALLMPISYPAESPTLNGSIVARWAEVQP